jgi:hypothetical protein
MGRRRYGPRPGVRYGPLTPLEIKTLRALADDLGTEHLSADGSSRRAVQGRMYRMRLKMGTFTTWGMVAKALRENIIT